MDKRTQLNIELLEASKAENAANITAHKQQTTRFRNALGRRLMTRQAAPHTPVPKVPLDFLAIGDSWFEYPLNGNGPSLGNTAIVAPSQLGSMGSPPPQILNQALHGQATTAVLSYENQETLISLLQDPDQWLNQQTHLPDAILLSAGGDDIVGDQLAIYLDYGGGGLNAQRFQGVLNSVQASYMDLFAFRDIFAKGVPIVAHCYDYAVPNNVHPVCVAAAWLYPSLTFAGYDYNEGLTIVGQMIDRFHDLLVALAANPAYNFSVIDTRSTLTRDASQPNGWANEIHPYPPGFTALANKFLIGLRGMPNFANRI
jgi:hypothetical protein